jgi:hypothetical protein
MIDPDEAIEALPVGPLIDSMGVTMALRPESHLTDVLVIGRTANMDPAAVGKSTGLVIAVSDGTDWIVQRGLIEAARTILADAFDADDDEDEDAV